MASDGASADFEYSLVTEIRAQKFHHEFVVKNYSRCKSTCDVNESIDGGDFEAGGYSWQILFFPNGKTDGESDEVYEEGRTSLVLALVTENVTVPCIFELHLRDLSENGKHHGRTVFNSFPPDVTYAKYLHLVGYPNFITRERLESSDYLKNDSLIIDCTIQLLLNATVQKVPLRNKNVDLLVQVADQTFRVNKSILSAHSTVFNSQITDALRQRRAFVIRDMEPTTFKAILWFLYTGTFLLEEDQGTFVCSGPNMIKSCMGKLFAAADLFKLKRLKNLCQSFILEKFPIEANSVAYYLELADICHATELRNACIIFASENRDVVAQSEGLKYLKRKKSTMYLELAGMLYTE